MLTTRFSLCITILRIDSEGTFLLYLRGLTIRGNSDDKVQIVTIGSADEVRGYHFLSMLYKSYGWYWNLFIQKPWYINLSPKNNTFLNDVMTKELEMGKTVRDIQVYSAFNVSGHWVHSFAFHSPNRSENRVWSLVSAVPSKITYKKWSKLTAIHYSSNHLPHIQEHPPSHKHTELLFPTTSFTPQSLPH